MSVLRFSMSVSAEIIWLYLPISLSNCSRFNAFTLSAKNFSAVLFVSLSPQLKSKILFNGLKLHSLKVEMYNGNLEEVQWKWHDSLYQMNSLK